MTALTEQDFRVKSDAALESARRALLPLADSEEFEVELQNGVLNLIFEEPAETKFVVSPNAPVRQIWVSAMARSFKLSWAPDLGAFALDGETLPKLLDRLLEHEVQHPVLQLDFEAFAVGQREKGVACSVQRLVALDAEFLFGEGHMGL